MIRYGSDGVEPYDRYVADPKYPPLNPKLRVYLEHSNELPWAVYPRFVWDDLRRKVAEEHPDWQIVNYDGKCRGADGTAMFRYHALRMKQLSDAFREVYAYFYPVQREISQMDAPLLQCVQEMNNRLSVSPQAGTILAEGNAASQFSGTVRSTAGVHAIKVKALGQPVTVETITVDRR